MDNNIEIMMEKIKEADMILVGIGEEMEMSVSSMKKNQDFLKNYDSLEKEEWLQPYLYKKYIENHLDNNIVKAYNTLEKILEGKNYFIVSTCIDDYVYKTNLLQERIVTPCGGFQFWQCEENCEHKIIKIDENVEKSLYNYLSNRDGENEIEKPLCEKCKKPLVFNNINAKNYAQEGYEAKWDLYMKWLQGTLNKKLCVIELGVGLQFPTVIRWPFEKVVFLNNKACLFRIHSKLFQLTEELKNKGYSIKEKPIDFLGNGFV